MEAQSTLWSVGIPQVPDEDHWFLVVRGRGCKPCVCIRIPGNGTDRLPAQVVQVERLFLSLDIPDRGETSATASDENVWDLLVPIHSVKVVWSSDGSA